MPSLQPGVTVQNVVLTVPANGGTVQIARPWYQGPCDPGCTWVNTPSRNITCMSSVVDPNGTVAETNELNNPFAGFPLQACDYCGYGGADGGGLEWGEVIEIP